MSFEELMDQLITTEETMKRRLNLEPVGRTISIMTIKTDSSLSLINTKNVFKTEEQSIFLNQSMNQDNYSWGKWNEKNNSKWGQNLGWSGTKFKGIIEVKIKMLVLIVLMNIMCTLEGILSVEFVHKRSHSCKLLLMEFKLDELGKCTSSGVSFMLKERSCNTKLL